MLMTWLYQVLAVPGLVKQVAIKHMDTVGTIGPLQLAIHVAQNRRAGEQKSHWDKTNKRHT